MFPNSNEFQPNYIKSTIIKITKFYIGNTKKKKNVSVIS